MELYHLLNRGVEKRNIVTSDYDRNRFVRSLYEMNDVRPVKNFWYRAQDPFSDLVGHYEDKRERLVTIHGWCLMGNHYHILLSENKDGGVTDFLRKLNVGYAKYFNEKHNRSGTLFQGRTKKILIEHESHFLWILHYIHFNALDFLKTAGSWREQCLINSGEALAWLERYRWSSYRDYVNKGKYASILAGSFMFDDRKTYMKEARSYLSTLADAPLPFSSLE